MKVLLTRPKGRNQLLAQALTEKHIPFLTAPLLSIAATPSNLKAQQSFLNADSIIFISTNAVKYAAKAIAPQCWPKSAQFIAVGEATHQALTQLGITAIQAPKDNQQTEGLLTIDALRDVAEQQIVIVRGVGGREDLATELKKRKAQLTYWEVYQRSCPTPEPNNHPEQWKNFGIDTIIITSGEALNNLITLVPPTLRHWLLACHILTPSARVESLAIKHGFTQVTNAKAANCHAMLVALAL